jgi:hypothetical protein
MNNVIPMRKASISTCPDKIFLLDQVVEKFSVLDAAIAGELYYWIAKGEQPWRVVSDYATWFLVNEKTIRLNIKNLDAKKFFKVTRTRMRSGSYGANKFSKSNSGNSKALVGMYVSLLNNNFESKDFGEFDPNEPEYRETPKFQILFLKTIQEVGDLKAAYILDRICWAFNCYCEESRGFNSMTHFARWANLDRKTAERKLRFLEKNGFLESKESGGNLVITVFEVSPAYSRFANYQEEKAESRKNGISEAFA